LDGMIVRVDAEKAGLALMETGEVLEFDEKSFNNFSYSVYVGMKISGTAVNAVKGSLFGRLNNISYRKYQNIYKINYKRIHDILLERFKAGEIFPVKEVIKFLKQECIIPNKYSYQNSVLFLESMADILRIDYSRKTVHIIGRTADEYADAVEITEKYMGFEEFTLFQEIALRDSGFWNKRNILLMGVTSSGKTVLPILKYLVDRKKSGKRKKMLIAVPYRALAFQMHNKLNELLKNFNLDIALSTSEIVEHDMKITNGDVDIAIVIYEKIFMRVSTINNILERYDYITLDEFGIVQSKERGIKAEMILLAGNSAKRPKISIIGTPYFKWDSYIKKYNFYPIKAYSRPVP
ncbi:MAG: DEAD/DEAH box helicase, partial [Oscillospiraceae bacterium]|nr:DEAD/DEAH box helicase [Oscillospiraceae bacterium]